MRGSNGSFDIGLGGRGRSPDEFAGARGIVDFVAPAV